MFDNSFIPDDLMEQVLKTDPLSIAERVTGKSYKDDEATSILGLLMDTAHNRIKQSMLKNSDDTYRSMPLKGFARIVRSLGFQVVYTESWNSEYSKGPEKFVLYYNSKFGLLLKMQTFNNVTTIDGISMYFNWRPFSPHCIDPIHGCSGHFEDGHVFFGDYSNSDGLRLVINKMLKYGQFITPWIHSPSLFLLNPSECRLYQIGSKDEISPKKISQIEFNLGNTEK